VAEEPGCQSVSPLGGVPCHVAVVDDEPAVSRALERVLRSTGFLVATFATAEEFLAQSVGDLPDCLVLDIYLEGMSGLDLYSKLLVKGVRIPTVFITAHDNPWTHQRILESGAAYLAKPFEDQALLNAIRTAIDHNAT
jgi:FixJ family two-component response regulator